MPTNVTRAQDGVHEYLVIETGPAGTTLVGTKLKDAGALPAGTYTCHIPISGLGELFIRLKATFASGSSTTSGGTKELNRSTTIQAFTGTGAMATNTLQELEVTTLKGERLAILTIVTVGDNVNFSVAEYFGKRS